ARNAILGAGSSYPGSAGPGGKAVLKDPSLGQFFSWCQKETQSPPSVSPDLARLQHSLFGQSYHGKRFLKQREPVLKHFKHLWEETRASSFLVVQKLISPGKQLDWAVNG
ncbi:hypothetical protein CEXT_448011, partial [Caerostris extrusa]